MAKLSKNKLSTIIRTIVREEVAMAIQEVITELKQPMQSIDEPQPTKITEKKKFSNNSVLNDVLNETAQSEEWKTMGGQTYDSSKINDVLQSSYGNIMNDKPNAEQMVASLGVSPERVPENVKDALTKDYSSLLKKMDEKAKASRNNG